MIRFPFTILAGMLALFSSTSLLAQTFNGTGGAIPDNGPAIGFPIQVTGLSPSVVDTNFGVETVCVNITHTWDSDLAAWLVSPSGAVVDLFAGIGSDGDNFTGTCFNADSFVSVLSGIPPFTGTFIPTGSLALLNNDSTGNGTWTLFLQDRALADYGNLLNWSITFGNHPAKPFRFFSSHLPILKINTLGQIIPDEPKITASLQIIDNGPGIINHVQDTPIPFSGQIGIEQRGNSSQMFPKKSYAFETRDSNGNAMNFPLLGMPAENDWVLIANYSDKSLMRNFLSYYLFERMGNYAPRMRFCDLMINGEYVGTYLVGEKIKRSGARVDIAKLDADDNAGDSLTGGYIWKLDHGAGANTAGWNSNYNPIGGTSPLYYQYHYPDDASLTPQQRSYLQSTVDIFENTMNASGFADSASGYPPIADGNSFIDVMLLTEFSKNVDGYWLSSYLYKDKDSRDPRIHCGPVWDFDLAWCNADYNFASYPGDWHYEEYAQNFQVMPFWWLRFMDDSNFVNRRNCRWFELRDNVFNQDTLFHFIDSIAAMIDSSQQMNFRKWPILGTYVWPNPSPIPTDYAGEVQKLKDWITFRLAWIDANIGGNCTPPVIVSREPASQTGELKIYPNPSEGEFFAEGYFREGSTLRIELLDNLGREIAILFEGTSPASSPFRQSLHFPPGTASGTYWIRLRQNNTQQLRRITCISQ